MARVMKRQEDFPVATPGELSAVFAFNLQQPGSGRECRRVRLAHEASLPALAGRLGISENVLGNLERSTGILRGNRGAAILKLYRSMGANLPDPAAWDETGQPVAQPLVLDEAHAVRPIPSPTLPVLLADAMGVTPTMAGITPRLAALAPEPCAAGLLLIADRLADLRHTIGIDQRHGMIGAEATCQRIEAIESAVAQILDDVTQPSVDA